MYNNLDGMKEAQKIAADSMSPRSQYMDRLDRYVIGTQYEGKVPFWMDCEVPLQERAPCIRYDIVKSAIRSFRSNLLGEGHFPDITSRMAYDDDEEGISKEDAKSIDRVNQASSSMARFQSGSKEVLSEAMSVGSAAAIFGTRNNRLFIDTVKAQWCTPKLDAEGNVLELEIKYPYIDTNLQLPDGKFKARAMWYRRVIDDSTDTTYLPVEIKEAGAKVRWVEDPDLSKPHGLDFCPVVWYAFERGTGVAGRFDGHAIHESATGEIDELNMLLSIKHRAALFSEGQWTEIGVEEGFNPTDAGRTPHVLIPSSPQGGTPSPDNPMSRTSGYLMPARQSGVRKKGLHKPWQYPQGKDVVQVELHAMPGDALKTMAECAVDERNKLSELLGVVFIDNENLPKGSAMSGTALTTLRMRFYERCEEIREDFGDHFIVPAFGMMLRIAIAKKLSLPGLKDVAKILDRVKDIWSWRCPPFELSWGEHNELDPDEKMAVVTSVTTMLDAGLLTKYMAIKMLRSIIGVEDIDAYMEDLEEETAAKQEQEQAGADDEHSKALEAQDQKFKLQAEVEKTKARLKPRPKASK